ncbi:MAG: SUMF1/EgtB/PvdO family nonheme iron enzyme [Treponema sp.]|nr:SUMF1/EgtB/PvdO family nonheme iron enzyme [Treponema sp.]
MKRIINQFIYLFFISIFVFTSCVNEIGNFENLDKSDSTSKQTYISIGSAVIADEINKSSRTIIANNTADLTDFVLNGTPSGGSERQLATAENTTKLSAARIPVTAGNWNFTLSAKIGTINFTGTTSAEITDSNTTDNPKPISFVLSSNVGYGGLNITMTFTGAADKVSVTLMDELQTITNHTQDFTTFTSSGSNTHKFTYSRDVTKTDEQLASGTYFLNFDFYKIKDSEEFKLNTSRNLIRIANGINTTASLSVSLNDAYEITYKYYVGDSELTDTTGISIAANSSSQVLPYSFSRKSEILLPTLTYSDPSYQFAGWYESSDFSGTPVTKIEKGSSGNKTLYARFVSSTLYVSQSGNNENDGMTASTALASVNKAVEKIISYGNIAAAYTIKISGTITGGVNIASTLTTEMASSLTLEGVTGKTGDTWVDVLDGGFTAGNTGTTLTLSTIVPVIIKNLKITGGYARDSGGIELYAKSFLTMDSGEISGNTGLDHAGGVYLHHGNGTWNGSSYTNVIPGAVFTMNGGTICNNTGEGITLYDGIAPGEFNMNGGTITGNSGYGVNIVYSTGPFGKFTMKGDAVVASNNKVFISCPNGTKIYIAGELTGSAPVATVTLNGYNENTEIVTLAEGVTDTSLLSAACAKIEVAPNNETPWYLTSDGKLTSTNPDGNSIPDDFVLVEGATITTPPEAFGDYGAFTYVTDSPITIQNFYMCTHEVTQAEYETYCIYGGTAPAETEDKDQYPAYNINWYDAIVYCNLRSLAENLTPVYSIGKEGSDVKSIYPKDWDSIRSNQEKTKFCGPDDRNSYWDSSSNVEVITINPLADGYRLPTNVEWEYAARGGNGLEKPQTEFSGSSTLSDVSNELYETIEKIMLHTANLLGIYDMNSAVNEWFLDPSGQDDYRRISTAQDPIDYNAALDPNERSSGSMKLGFRVVRNAGANGGSNP